MSYEKLRDEALKNADYEKVSELAVELPKVLALASKGGEGNMTRSTGLILTKEQIISLKDYVAIGFVFPVTLDAVIDFLSYGPGEDGGRGLTAADFLSTFRLIRNHATSWTPLRHRIMLTGTDLKQFGSKMQTWGAGMEAEYKGDAAVQLIKKYNVKTLAELNALTLGWEGAFPGIELDPETVVELISYLQEIRDRIEDFKEKTQAIKTDLDTFGDDLENQVIPEIKRKLVLIGNNKYTGEVEVLNNRISERALRIEQLDGQYKALVVKSLEAAAGLNIFGLGMAIYHGVEAENIRAARRVENEELEADILSLNSKNVTLASLKRVEKDLQNTKVVAIEAEVATNNLRYVWNVIDAYVVDSEKEMAGINDSLRLSRFMSKFAQVVDSWKEVERVADLLVDVFDQADKEYQMKHGTTGMARKISSDSLVFQRYPEVDLSLLSQAMKNMRGYRATADALFIVWSYLPSVHARFTRLVDKVFDSARVLQVNAFGARNDLEKSIKTYGVLYAELKDEVGSGADAETIKTIVDEIEEVLKGATDSIKKKAIEIERTHQNISTVFDKTMTLGYVADLKKDIQTAELRRTKLETELAKRLADLKVVTDAINAIEKSGLDDLSKDVNLTIDKLKGLGMAPTEVQLVLFAIEQLQKSIGDIAKGISFSFMIAETKKLSAKVKETQDGITEQATHIEASNKNIEFIEAIHQIDDQGKQYGAEYNKSVVAFNQFVATIESGSDEEEERWNRYVSEAQDFIPFISPLSLPNP